MSICLKQLIQWHRPPFLAGCGRTHGIAFGVHAGTRARRGFGCGGRTCALLLLLVRTAIGVAADDPAAVVLSETFDAAADLAAPGWNLAATAEQSEWRIEAGRLVVVCHRNPYKGGRIFRTVPMLPRGILEFDALFGAKGLGNYNHLSLGFRLYGHMTSFKKYAGHQWLAYRPSEKKHDLITNRIPLGQWVHIRMVFDIPAARVEYYFGDGDDPVWVDTRFAVDPTRAEPQLEFFNYGLCAGTVTHLIDNVVLRRQAAAVAGAPNGRDRVLVFEGISADRYRVAAAMVPMLDGGRVSTFSVVTRGAAIMPSNQLALRSVPSARRWRAAAEIVLADVPVGPGQCVPEHVLDSLVQAVRDGAHLLVLGGMFALGKGGYAGTALGALLPVTTDDRWAVRRFPKPALLRARVPAWTKGLGEENQPAVLWYHETTLRGDNVEVLLEADGKPMLVRDKAGQGTVTVFLGTTCGDFNETKDGGVPFWEWSGWAGLVRQMMGGMELARGP